MTMLMRVERSRSPRSSAPSIAAQEAVLTDFARIYWAPPDEPDVPPWVGGRAAQVIRYRDRLVSQVEAATQELDLDLETGYSQLSKHTVVRWQTFTFFDDVARMTDVLFRGPIEPRHADEVDLRLHGAWRRLQATTIDFDEFANAVADFRVSAVRVAMILETARPPEANQMDGSFELPNARTLAGLLSLRCEKDDVDELLEMYRLVCQKLQGTTCTWCGDSFEECSAAGLFDGSDSLVIPTTVPKVVVPQCGHAIHTLCFGSQLIPDPEIRGLRGCCRRCGLSYAWSSIDVDPLINAFCLLFGSYVDKRAYEMRQDGEVANSVVVRIAEVCQNLSRELEGLVSPPSAWILLAKRHEFSDPETVSFIGDLVLRILSPAESECGNAQERLPMPPTGVVVGPDDRSESDGDRSIADEEDKHITEVYLPDKNSDSEQEFYTAMALVGTWRHSSGGEIIVQLVNDGATIVVHHPEQGRTETPVNDFFLADGSFRFFQFTGRLCDPPDRIIWNNGVSWLRIPSGCGMLGPPGPRVNAAANPQDEDFSDDCEIGGLPPVPDDGLCFM